MSEANMDSVVVVGTGGREFELARQMAPDAHVYWANASVAAEFIDNVEAVEGDPLTIARQTESGLVVVGPEAPLVDGLGNALRAEGISVFGPNRDGAMMTEGSKAECLGLLERAGVLTPRSMVIEDRHDDRIQQLITDHKLWVYKADGLAAGKGVYLTESEQEAEEKLYGMLSGELHGDAGRKVVAQERLHGPELSVTVVFDGQNFVILPSSQDHKRLEDGDRGPNTGGMGAYSPVPESIISEDQMTKVHEMVTKLTDQLKEEGVDYRGTLYLGLMMAEEYDGDPVVLEINARFGDPEAQAVFPVMNMQTNVNTYDLLKSAAEGKLNYTQADMESEIGAAAVTVVLAGGQYPNKGSVGQNIFRHDYRNNPQHPHVITQYAGVKRGSGAHLLTNGGRVLARTGIAVDHTGTLAQEELTDIAATCAYATLGDNGNGGTFFDGMRVRQGIAKQARGGKK